MKILSWNVNGLRAVVKKEFYIDMQHIDADIICLQETKAQPEEVSLALAGINGYEIYSNSAEQKGYSSTAILTKKPADQIIMDIQVPAHDREGRVITADLGELYLITAYVPNAGRGLVRLDYRQEWDRDFLTFIKNLDRVKPVVLCGDLNVAHQAIDLAHPKSNFNKTAGYTQQEIDGFSRILEAGFTDVFRHLYPTEIKYTWWSYMFNARLKNVGWRIDYFIISDRLLPKVKDCKILNEVQGSDHCPIILELIL